MIIKFAKWGNSLGLRIPMPIVRELDIRVLQPVDLTISNGSLIVTPVSSTPVYSLSFLVRGITEENRHVEFKTWQLLDNAH